MEKSLRRICTVHQTHWKSLRSVTIAAREMIQSVYHEAKNSQQMHRLTVETFIPGTLKVLLRGWIPFWKACLDYRGWKSASSLWWAGGDGRLSVPRRRSVVLWTWRCDRAECRSGLCWVPEGRGVEKGVGGGCCWGRRGGLSLRSQSSIEALLSSAKPRFFFWFFLRFFSKQNVGNEKAIISFDPDNIFF